MVGWTNEETFKFIELYQKEPCIWNPKNRHHKDKTKVNDAWLRIANTMGVPVAELKKKKETLLAAFRLNHKKVIASRTSGAAEEEIYKPIWIFYDALAAFILDVYECKTIITTEDQVNKTNIQDETSSEEETSSQILDEAETENTDPRRANQESFSIPVQKRRSQNPVELQETNAQVKNALTTLNNVLKDNKKNQCEDECDLYGRLIASKLRKFAESDRQELMYEIDGLVLKKRRSIVAGPSSVHKKVSSPSQIIISTNRNRPSTSRNTHVNYSQPMYILDNRPLSSQSNYSSSTPNSVDFNYQQASSNDSALTSPPQVYTTNQPSFWPELHLPDQSEEAYTQSQHHNDILLKAVSEAQLQEHEDN